MKAPAFDYVKPKNLDEAFSFLKQYGSGAQILAGGQSLMAIGQQDPVLGEPVMRALQNTIHGCSEVMLLPQGGHFVQEHGEPIAQRALDFFHPKA